MARGGIYDRSDGKEYQWPSQLIDKEMGSENLAYALGTLLDVLLDKGVISAEDAIEIIPGADRWFTPTPPQGDEK
jgi:hypothetical protein